MTARFTFLSAWPFTSLWLKNLTARQQWLMRFVWRLKLAVTQSHHRACGLGMWRSQLKTASVGCVFYRSKAVGCGFVGTWSKYNPSGWLRGTVVECRSLTCELPLFCARPAADGWPLMWVNRPLWVSQPGRLSLSSFRGR